MEMQCVYFQMGRTFENPNIRWRFSRLVVAVLLELLFNPEDGGDTLFRKLSGPNYTTLKVYPRFIQ
jgi:hypothetical protein